MDVRRLIKNSIIKIGCLILVLSCISYTGFGQYRDTLVEKLFSEVEYTNSNFKKAAFIPDNQNDTQEVKDGKSIPTWVWIVPAAGVAGYLTYLVFNKKEEPIPPDPPQAKDDVLNLLCNTDGSINILSNDIGPGIQIQNISQPSGITIVQLGGGLIQVSGISLNSFSFGYSIIDELGRSTAAMVQVNVEVPVVDLGDDSFTIMSMSAFSGNVLENDNGSGLRIVDHTEPMNGSLSLVNDGSFIYTPSSLFCGEDQFFYTVHDNCGQESIGHVLINGFDEQPPEISCPDDVILDCELPDDISSTGFATAIDNCSSINEIIISFIDDDSGRIECNSTGIKIRTWKAEDKSGHFSTCVQSIEKKDDQKPNIQCPADVSVECDSETNPAITGLLVADDLCGPVNITYSDDQSGISGCANTGVIIRLWEVADECGNAESCEQQITVVQDQLAPSIVCPDNMTISCIDSTEPQITGTAEATDLCSELGITFADDHSGIIGCNGSGVIIRTWKAEDACGNHSMCEQMISISEDDEEPIISCPQNQEVLCGESIGIEILGEATATDLCGDLTISHSDDLSGLTGCNSSGTIIRTWKAEDACNNTSECQQQIVVAIDNVPPVIECPPDLTVDCQESLSTDMTGELSVEDNCSEVDIEFNDNVSGLTACNQTGVVSRTWLATDACGNYNSCNQQITIAPDEISPIITCPPDTILLCGDSTLPESTGEPTAEDACSDQNQLSFQFTDFNFGNGCDKDWQIIRTWRVSDPCENMSNCVQNINILADKEGPELVCPSTTILSCNSSIDPDIIGYAQATDNCSPEIDIVIEYTDMTPTGDICEEVIERNWKAIDLCGNVSSCMQRLLLLDGTSPVISCPPDIVVNCEKDPDPQITGYPSAEDNCDGLVKLDYSDNSASMSCAGEVIRSWMATDECGNTSECDQIITLFDQVAPAITCPPDISIDCDQQAYIEITGIPSSIDNCASETTHSYEDAMDIEGCTGIITRVWTALDGCNNMKNCNQLITLQEPVCDFTHVITTKKTVCGASNGTASIAFQNGQNSKGGYLVEWHNRENGSDITDLAMGTYRVTVTDTVLHCMKIFEYSIGEEDPQYISDINAIPEGCSFDSDIQIQFDSRFEGPMNLSIYSPNGGFMGLSGLPTSQMVAISTYFGNVMPGEYRFVMYDESIGQFCSQEIHSTVVTKSSYELQIGPILLPSAHEANDGRFFVSITEGNLNPPFAVYLNGEFVFDVQGFSFLVNGLVGGDYTIQVIDSNGCSSEVHDVSLPAPPPDPDTTDFQILVSQLIVSANGDPSVRLFPPEKLLSGVYALAPNDFVTPTFRSYRNVDIGLSYRLTGNVKVNLNGQFGSGMLNGEFATYDEKYSFSNEYRSFKLIPSLRFDFPSSGIFRPHLDVGLMYRHFQLLPSNDSYFEGNATNTDLLIYNPIQTFLALSMEIDLGEKGFMNVQLGKSNGNRVTVADYMKLGLNWNLNKEKIRPSKIR